MSLSDYDFILFSKLSDMSSKISQSEGFDIVHLIDKEVSDFEDKKKVEFIRYFLDDLISASADKKLDFDEKKKIIKKRAAELLGEKKGILERSGDGSVTRGRGKVSLDKDPEDWRSRLKLSVEGIG